MNTNRKDSGEYTIQIGKFSRKLQLKIKKLFLECPSNLECTEGEEAIFTCKLLPDSPSVILQKDDIDITNKCKMSKKDCGDTHVIYSLKLKNTKSNDSGEYSLQVGKAVRKVQLKINVYFLEDPSNLEYTEGEDAIFTCKVLPDSPSVVLRKDDIDITNKCEMSKKDCGDTHVIHTLKLKNTNSSDSGEYSLQVGKSVRKVQLKINGYFLEDPSNVGVIEGKEAILTCTVRQGSTPVKWLKDGIELMQNENCVMYDVDIEQERKIQLTLNNTNGNDSGEYIVKVGQFSRKLQLEIKSYFLQDPFNVVVIEGEEAILKCKVRQESTSIKWLKDGIEIIQNENCILSNIDTQHEQHLQLLLMNTNRKDSGEYTIQIGKFTRKLQLKIKTYFLEDPSDTECKEGEDAVFKCKVCSDSPSVQLLKDGIDITEKTNYEKTSDGQLHTLKLVNTTTSDRGDYCVHVGKSYRKVRLIVKEKPSTSEKKTYMEAIKAETEVRKYVRIQVIGKGGAGKTSLVRRLLRRDIDGVESTDGIEIERTCSIKESDGEWRFNTFETEMDRIGKRVLQAVNKNKTSKKPVLDLRHVSDDRVFETDIKQDSQNRNISKDKFLKAEKNENQILPTDENKPLQTKENTPPQTNSENSLLQASKRYPVPAYDNKPFILNKPRDIAESLVENLVSAKFNKSIVTDTVDASAIKPNRETLENQNDVSLEKSDQITVAMIDNMDEILLEVKNKKEKDSSDGLVDCGLWDFAGQKDYYVTHQTFCTPHAIYLLVADITEEITPIQYDDTFIYDCSAEYIDFWLESIHCIRNDVQESTVKELRPPVIMVVTGIDKVTDEEVTKKQYREKFLSTFGCQAKGGHKRGMIHFISNKTSPEEDFTNLRKHIWQIADEMQFFAETLPTRWIELENALEIVRTLKKQKNMDLRERWENVEKLAQKISIDKNELLLFLNYQHKIGNLIFFEDKPDYIILEPNWLVDCFKCLVCDDDKKQCAETELYDLKYQGLLSDELIDKLFRKVPGLMIGKSRNHILDVLEKFDIIIKLENSYFMPCMIDKSSTLPDIKNAFNVESSNCTPWLILEFKFLPIAFCNYILFKYIKENTICEVKQESGDGRPAIYAGKAIVYLDSTKCRKAIICFSKNAICIQIWKWKNVDDITYQNIIERICNSIEELVEKSNYKLDYKVKSKCSNGDYMCSSDRITYEDLSLLCEGHEYFCEEHNAMHNKEDIENTWLKHAADIEKKRRDAQDEKMRKIEEVKSLTENQIGMDITEMENYEAVNMNTEHKERKIIHSLNGNGAGRKLVTIPNSTMNQERYTIKCVTAVVINISDFVARNGINYDKDAAKLMQTFDDIGYNTYLLNNVTENELVAKFEEIKTKKMDCLIVALLTRGDEDTVAMTDRSIKIKHLMGYFNAENCPELILKPKIFIFQTCRGPAIGTGVSLIPVHSYQRYQDNSTSVKGQYTEYGNFSEYRVDVKASREQNCIPDDISTTIKENERVIGMDRGGTFIVGPILHYSDDGGSYSQTGITSIPNNSDFLEVYSTSYGHGSFVNTLTGSPFINSLTSRLIGMKKYDDFLNTLTRVNNDVGLKYKPNYPASRTCATQMPCFTSYLTKELNLYIER